MDDVMKLEEELEGIETLFSNPSVTAEKLAEAGRRHQPLKAEIEEKTALWEELAGMEDS